MQAYEMPGRDLVSRLMLVGLGAHVDDEEFASMLDSLEGYGLKAPVARYLQAGQQVDLSARRSIFVAAYYQIGRADGEKMGEWIQASTPHLRAELASSVFEALRADEQAVDSSREFDNIQIAMDADVLNAEDPDLAEDFREGVMEALPRIAADYAAVFYEEGFGDGLALAVIERDVPAFRENWSQEFAARQRECYGEIRPLMERLINARTAYRLDEENLSAENRLLARARIALWEEGVGRLIGTDELVRLADGADPTWAAIDRRRMELKSALATARKTDDYVSWEVAARRQGVLLTERTLRDALNPPAQQR